MEIKTKIQNKIKLKNVKKSIQKGKIKSLAQATSYLWKLTQTSIRKRQGQKQKPYKLYIYDKDDSTGKKPPIETVASYIRRQEKEGVEKRRVVKWWRGKGQSAGRNNDREMLKTVKPITHKPSPANSPPYSWKKRIPNRGWGDYWLRNSIKYNPEQGQVYSSPRHATKAAPIPKIMEYGGESMMYYRKLMGYRVYPYEYKNEKRIVFNRVYERHQELKSVQKHPFMKPSAIKAAKVLPKIYAQRINVQAIK
jgi:hypothetical protein